MGITCYKCFPPKEPCVLVINRIPTAPLCEKCGIQLVDVVEKLDFPAEEFNQARNAETVEELAQTAGEETGPEPPPTFEEIDGMDEKEVIILADKLGVPWREAELTENVKSRIKDKLTADYSMGTEDG